MNRAKRGELEMHSKEPIYVYKEPTYIYRKSEAMKHVLEDIKGIEKDIRNKVIEQLMGVMVTTLHKTFKLGKKRIHRYIDEFNNQFHLIETGQITFEELNKYCEEYGIKTKIEEERK